VQGAGAGAVAPAIITPPFAVIVETISIATKQVVVIQPLSVVMSCLLFLIYHPTGTVISINVPEIDDTARRRPSVVLAVLNRMASATFRKR